MARIFVNGLEGTTSASLAQAGVTLQGDFLASMPVVTGSDWILLTIDPDDELEQGFEIVRVTAHTASSTSATIQRAREGTSAPTSWPSGVKVVASVTKADLDGLVSATAQVASDLAEEVGFIDANIAQLDENFQQHHGSASTAAHPPATTDAAGFMSASDKSKLNGIAEGAQVNLSASATLDLLKTVDGAGSGLDADLLDGNSSAAFATAAHNHSGVYAVSGHQHPIWNATLAYKSADASTSSTTLTAMTMTAEAYDTLSGHSTSSNTQRVVLGEGGLYLVIAQATFAAASGGTRMVQISQNGSGNVRAVSRVPSAGSVEATVVNCQALVFANAGTEYVEAHTYQDSGGALNVIGSGGAVGGSFLHVLRLMA